MQVFLSTSLFEQVRHVGFVGEIDHTLAADNAAVPLFRGPVDKLITVERVAAEIDESTNAVLFHLASIVVMVAMAVSAVVVFMMLMPVFVVMFVLVFTLMVVVMVVSAMRADLVIIIVVIAIVVVVMVFVFIVLLFFNRAVEFGNPTRRKYSLAEIKAFAVHNALNIDIAEIGLNNLGVRLQCAYNDLQFSQFFRRDKADFVKKNDVAELNLLDNKVFNIFLVNILLNEFASASEFLSHTEGVDHRNDGICRASHTF